MSPPCVAAIFDGENGGATSMGVTATEIRIGIPVHSAAFDTSGPVGTTLRAAMDAMIDHFQGRYEFYGRRIVPVYVNTNPVDAATSRAAGADVAAEGVFGALTGLREYAGNPQVALAQELARNRIVTITRNAGPWWTDKTLFDPNDPYVWSVYPSAEDNLANLGEFACASLAGHVASHAPDSGLRNVIRRFGVVAFGHQAVPSVSVLTDRLGACGPTPTVVSTTSLGGTSSNDLRTGFSQLQAAGVTTVICVCEQTYVSTAMSTAKTAGFQPEWVGSSVGYYNIESSGGVGLIRVDPSPKLLPLQARPFFGYMLERIPQLVNGEERARAMINGTLLYDGLLVLAAGIQGAGPNLTPETFAAALMTTQFSNPGAGQAPYWQPSAGFGPGDHALYDDYALAWWSPTAPALEATSGGPGSWCYAGMGARYRVGTYPADVDGQLFNTNVPCR